MTIRNADSNMKLAWALIGVVTIGRMIYAQSFLLVPDETNYWQWSRYLAWGYHDQTPMIAWTIRLFTSFMGHTELAVRLPSILSMAVGSIYLVLIARRWFTSKIALHTAYLSQAVLIFNIGAILATADGLQGAAWAAASYYTARGFEENRWRHWLQGGAWFGFGILSKYTMVLFLPIVLCFGLVTPACRSKLRTMRPYIGCLVGAILFMPVVVWNAENDWNSIRHVAYLGGANEGFRIHLKFLGEYLASQLGLLTPMVFIVVYASWFLMIRRWRRFEHWIHSFLFFTSFPVVAGFAILSLHTRVYGNWACFGYLTASVLTVALWLDRKDKSSQTQNTHNRSIWRWTLGSAVAFTVLVFTHVIWPILPIPAHLDRAASEISGWKQLGETVGKVSATMPRPDQSFIYGLDYQTASELAFYVPGKPKTVSINRWHRPNVYDYWWQDSDLIGKDAVGAINNGNSRQRLLEIFAQVDPPIKLSIFSSSTNKDTSKAASPSKTFYLYKCYGFKGGLRWLPRNRDDVRARKQ